MFFIVVVVYVAGEHLEVETEERVEGGSSKVNSRALCIEVHRGVDEAGVGDVAAAKDSGELVAILSVRWLVKGGRSTSVR